MPKIISNKSSVDLDYPVVRPSLDLDFTQEVLDERITFSRGSIGTRVNRNRLIETVSANQPRFDYDPVTGECKGLLIEESRQNLFTYSNDFSQGVWSKTRTNILSNAAIAPDGTNTAFKLYNDITSNASHRMTSSYVTSASLPTGSIFVKAAEYDRVLMSVVRDNGTGFAGGEVAFDLKSGTIITNLGYGGTTGKIEPYGNGWYRISIVSTITATTNYGLRINLLNTFQSSAATYTGDGTSGIYIWGAQVEIGAFPTSYIPTSGSTVTRSADNASMTGTNFSSWYNQTEGTLYARWSIPVKPSGFPGIANIQDSGRNNGVIISTNLNNNNRVTVRGSNLTIIDDYTNLTIPLNSVAGSAIAYRTNSTTTDAFYSGNGGNESSRSVTKNIPIVNVDRLLLGNNVGNILSGHIRRVTYYPRALKPNQLQLLTQ